MSDAAPLVSVLIPVYNDAPHLARAIESVLSQTVRDIEVVVADDASTDDSAAVARRYADMDARVRPTQNPANLGMTGNWNAALARATGRYVVKLDSDDAYEPRALEQLLAPFDTAEPPLVSFCRTLQCDAELAPVSDYLGDTALVRAGFDPLSARQLPAHSWYHLSFDDIQLWHSNAFLCRTEVLRRMGGWDESFGCASDTDLILRFLESDGGVAHVPYPGVLYRARPGSVSDGYRRSELLSFESSVVHLRSLQRYRARGGRLDRRLVFAWQRYSQAHRRLRPMFDALTARLKPQARARLLAASDDVVMPPLVVRLRERLDGLHQAVRRVTARRA